MSAAGTGQPTAAATSTCTASKGPLLVLTGALAFAGANVVAKALYLRGSTLVTVFLIRCAVVYLVNGALVAFRQDLATAKAVLLLQTGRSSSSLLAGARGFVGALTGVLLNISFLFLTLADAFTLFKGTDTIGTIALSSSVLGSHEKLSYRELASGAVTLVGLVLIAQPPILFGDDVAAVSLAGLCIAVIGGLCSASFNLFTRELSRDGRPLGAVSPPQLLSYFMVVVFLCVAIIGLVAKATGLDSVAGFEWTKCTWPHGFDWFLILVYCAGILSGQLTMAAGFATTRAGIAAILAVSEIAFAYVLDIVALKEPTNGLATAGTAIVFGSLGVLAIARAPAPPTTGDEEPNSIVMDVDHDEQEMQELVMSPSAIKSSGERR